MFDPATENWRGEHLIRAQRPDRRGSTNHQTCKLMLRVDRVKAAMAEGQTQSATAHELGIGIKRLRAFCQEHDLGTWPTKRGKNI